MAIKRKLTFVVGAGASYELGFPTGRGLLEKISRLSSIQSSSSSDSTGNGKYVKINNGVLDQYIEAISQDSRERSVNRELVSWISQNCPLAPSIDNLLHTHQTNAKLVQVGKAMICAALMDSEINSCLMPDTQKRSDKDFLHKAVNGKSGPTSWLCQLFWLLAEGNTFEEFLLSLTKVAFISFNYDRCIQHFLVNAATSYFRLTDQRLMKELHDNIFVVFPYGSLGDLTVDKYGVIGFGETQINSAVSNIKTFTEGLKIKEDRSRLTGMITDCDELVFLGFGFHDINLNLLFEDCADLSIKRISGTAKSISNRNLESISYKLYSEILSYHTFKHLWDEGRIVLQDLTCCEYFSANSVALRS